jgi:hypothetical protein
VQRPKQASRGTRSPAGTEHIEDADLGPPRTILTLIAICEYVRVVPSGSSAKCRLGSSVSREANQATRPPPESRFVDTLAVDHALPGAYSCSSSGDTKHRGGIVGTTVSTRAGHEPPNAVAAGQPFPRAYSDGLNSACIHTRLKQLTEIRCNSNRRRLSAVAVRKSRTAERMAPTFGVLTRSIARSLLAALSAIYLRRVTVSPRRGRRRSGLRTFALIGPTRLAPNSDGDPLS